ncbi:peptidoglycan-binding protein [Amylibacter sp. IMCC11727]|uniref:peptidoglycan-binding domain-containing protein n=1 Tax=Amylibacter sp. IMCC11727 TaxID=3039851 RepID=UPI00244DCE6E|nr:peptidoglycan-binding protein [Amylibacter sp. IMCC11727]WGI21245.1 peptidoglycan-binding protein [Amylibacter sp. IMCC11727]
MLLMKSSLRGSETATFSKTFVGATVAVAMAATTVVTPTPARAGAEEIFGALVVIGVACAASGKCKGKKKAKAGRKGKKKAKGGGGGSVGYGINKSERRLVQEGLAAKGHYTAAIDGSFGPGTRKSIRAYQAAIGAKVTGKLTPVQINDLAAASVAFASIPDDSPMLFQSVLVRDTTKAQLREIQVRLNEKGFPAGVPDGAWGGSTRRAVEAYKAANGLPGKTLASQRLLAHMNGVVMAREGGLVAGVAVAAAGLDGGVLGEEEGQGVATFEDLAAKTVVEEEPVEAEVAAVSALQFEVLGMRPGMNRSEIEETVIENLGEDVTISVGGAEDIGAEGQLSLGHVLSQPNWPEPGSEQVMAVYDEKAPADGAIAIFRSIVMPEGFTKASFTKNIVPKILSEYGKEGLVNDDLVWIGDSETRLASRKDLAMRASCGDLALKQPEAEIVDGVVSWEAKTAPTLNADAAAGVSAKCGDVMTVDFEDGMLNFAVWNSDMLAGGADDASVPVIKF